MIAYPETQKRAQQELDEVVGRERLPSFEDYEKLPYIRAMVCPAYRLKLGISSSHANLGEGGVAMGKYDPTWNTTSFYRG